MDISILVSPKEIFSEYEKGTEFKNSIGERGIAEQAKVNERFYVGDHWHGAQFGKDRPLLRRPLIKRIHDFKFSHIASNPLAVNYTAEGIPFVAEETESRQKIKEAMMNGETPKDSEVSDDEISVVMEALSSYFRTTAERVKFEIVKWMALRNAGVDGTTIVWCYWDETIKTGLYADNARQVAIKGDLSIEVLNVSQVVFGDPYTDNVQRQPFIIIAQRLHIDEVKREAKRNGVSKNDIDTIKPDDDDGYSVNFNDNDTAESREVKRVTVLTKLYKEFDDNGDYKVMCTRVCKRTVIRKPFDMKIQSYPIAKMSWEPRRGSIYGVSDITYMIPNQIAVNRALSAEVWSMMTSGMPITLVNGSVITETFANTPGRTYKVFGSAEDMQTAVRFVQPPQFNSQFINGIENLANNTLSDSGANDAALGNMRPDNAAAIIQLQEASKAPLQVHINRFYDMIEDIARIWADFWLHMYGDRKLKITDKNGVRYFAFSAERYKNLIINAKIDVGASTMRSEAVSIATLDNLLNAQRINFLQYLERVPAGIIPNKTDLLADVRAEMEATAETQYMNNELSDEKILQLWAAKDPEGYRRFTQLPPEQQQAALVQMRGAMQNASAEPMAGEVVA